MHVDRAHLLQSVRASLAAVPVTVLTGPRQSGKTTLARDLLNEHSPNYFDLEDPVTIARLKEPVTALGVLESLVVIDEDQRRPDLFPVLRVLVARRSNAARYLILGSAAGGLPRSFLATTDDASLDWRRDFIRTLLERDFPQWGVQVAATALQRFWSTLAHRHAQLWNAADLARVLGVDPTTARRYLDLLTDALVVRQLQPWHA